MIADGLVKEPSGEKKNVRKKKKNDFLNNENEVEKR